MNRSLSRAIASITFLLPALWFSGCGGKDETVITVGVAGPMTGDQSKMGQDFRNGVELAVEEWNGRGGVLGKKIRIDVNDDQHDPKQAVAVASKMVNKGVAGVIGHFNSSCSIPASDIYAKAGVPMITPASTNPKLTEKGHPTVFRVCGRDDQQGKVAADFVANVLKSKRVAVLHDKTEYGQGLADEFRKSLGTRAGVAAYEAVIQGDKDFKAVLTKVKRADPDLLYFGGVYPEAGLLVRQARELGIAAPLFSGDGTIDTKFIEIAGPAAEGTYLTFSPDPEKVPTAKAFLDSYRKKYGPHGPYSIYAYDAANILLSAIRDAGTTDGRAVSKKIHDSSFRGALGEIAFDPKGDVRTAPYVVWITRGGKFEEIGSKPAP